MTATAPATWFQRFLLPGFAFKAVVIGGGYATGRELAEFFLPSGPWGGLAGMLLATLLWSLVAAITFTFAFVFGAFDYRAFFARLLGRGWILFETAYALFVILILAVFGAAAGAIVTALFGWPPLAGTFLLAAGIAGFAAFGNASIERLFKYVSFMLYGVYGLFLILALTAFKDRIAVGFTLPGPAMSGWVAGGITYASYNVVGAVAVLPMLRHLTSRRDAIVSGLVAGPLAMAPAIVFFICMAAFYPQIGSETLPSDFMLRRMGSPAFHLLFQLMIFCALLESGAGSVHAINERLAAAWHARRGRELGPGSRAMIAGVLLVGCMFLADRFGLVALIAKGYRGLALLFLAVYVLPLFTVGLMRLLRAPVAIELPATPGPGPDMAP